MTSGPRLRPTSPPTAHAGRNFRDRESLLMIGTFADPQQDGSMAIFTTRGAAEEFVKGDPFVLHGVVRLWRILEWNEALNGP